jgi:hypothetical protein
MRRVLFQAWPAADHPLKQLPRQRGSNNRLPQTHCAAVCHARFAGSEAAPLSLLAPSRTSLCKAQVMHLSIPKKYNMFISRKGMVFRGVKCGLRKAGDNLRRTATRSVHWGSHPLPSTNWFIETSCNYRCRFCFATFQDIPSKEVLCEAHLMASAVSSCAHALHVSSATCHRHALC